MPSDENEDIESIKEKLVAQLSKEYVLGNSKVEELAFGIKVLKVIAIVEDKGGLSDEVEEKIRSFPGVGEVEVEEVTLIS